MLFDIIGDFISSYVNVLESIFKLIPIRVQVGPLKFELKQRATSTYEATLEQIEQTRAQLERSISTIDTLHTEITAKKRELDTVLESIQTKEKEKQTIDQERELSQRLLQEDVDRLRDVIGVYQLRQSRIDKIMGFLGGVFASLAAAVVWTLVAFMLKK